MLKNFLHKNLVEAGCDEAGRGCIAGPVFAAAVVLSKSFKHPDLNDSKLLSEKKRDELRIFIEDNAIAWSVAKISPMKIDKINILNASILAMHDAIRSLGLVPDHLLIDGNRFKVYNGIPFDCIIKGDGKYNAIAAASILAKTHRDEYMCTLHHEYPSYKWNQNKGYPTSRHRDAVFEHGITSHHRKTFSMIPDQFKLNL